MSLRVGVCVLLYSSLLERLPRIGYSRQCLLSNGSTCLARLYLRDRSTGPGQGHTCMMSRAVQNTAPQLCYVGTFLGSNVVVACEVFHRSCEAEALL
jgi:hypothetical protein